MAVGLRFKFNGGPEEQYDTLHSALGVEGDPPGGLILHSSGPVDGGWGIIDFWESRDHFDRFMESRLGPTLQELGDRAFPGQPDLKEFPVHHILKP